MLNIKNLSVKTSGKGILRGVDLEIKYSQVIEDLKTLIGENPTYGYKRAAPELKENYGHQINKKVVLKLMRNQNLQLLRKARKPKPSLIAQKLTHARGQNESGGFEAS